MRQPSLGGPRPKGQQLGLGLGTYRDEGWTRACVRGWVPDHKSAKWGWGPGAKLWGSGPGVRGVPRIKRAKARRAEAQTQF